MGPPRVMVAYDGSPAARRALVHAAEIVGRTGSVDVVNVIPAQSVGSRLETVSDDQLETQETILAEAGAVLASHGVDVELVGTCGDPYSEILATAERREIQILVVGRGRRWRHILGGSLAIQLAGRSHQDVLVVG